jgi:hypothetical protein
MNFKLLGFAMLFAGCGGLVGDDAGDGANISLRPPVHIPHGLGISIDSINPSVPIEKRPTVVHFTLTNFDAGTHSGTVGATVSPAGSAPFTTTNNWRVDSLAGGFASMSGVVVFDAPFAGINNQVTIFFTDAATGQQAASAQQAFNIAGRFSFQISSVYVGNPRSKFQDTDYAGLAIVDQNGKVLTEQSAYVGNGGSGTDFTVPVPLLDPDPIDVIPDVDSITIGSVVANWGHTPQQSALGQMALDEATGQPFSVMTHNFLDCDGIVEADQRSLTGRQLYDATDGSGNPAELTAYTADIHAQGTPSPTLCGAESHYGVVLTALRRDSSFEKAIIVNPPVSAVRSGAHEQMSVASGEAVDWSVDGGAINGYVDPTGVYHMPAGFPANTLVTVRASARDGSGRTGVAFVQLDPTVRPIVLVPPGTFNPLLHF